MEKHLQAIERLTKKNDLEGLVFRMILIKRDVDEYHKKTYDYKINSIYFYVEEVVTELHKSNPDIQISKKDIVSYKMYVRTLMNRLPIDFFLNKDFDSYSNDGPSPSMDIGITISLCGFFIHMLPIPGCAVIGKALMTIGGGVTLNAAINRIDENYKRRKERERRERREREGYWDSEDNTQWVDRRNERPLRKR